MDQTNSKLVLPPVQQGVFDVLREESQRLREWGYYLGGDTALALQLGHRQSVDFDFFSLQPGLGDSTYEWLESLPDFILREKDANTLHGQIQEVKVSFISAYKYPPAIDTIEIEGISVAHIVDIGAMKLLAITSRAALRDYIDIAAILKSGTTLSQLLEASQEKYGPSFDTMVPLRALLAYDSEDMDTEIPTLLDATLKSDWKRILNAAVKEVG